MIRACLILSMSWTLAVGAAPYMPDFDVASTAGADRAAAAKTYVPRDAQAAYLDAASGVPRVLWLERPAPRGAVDAATVATQQLASLRATFDLDDRALAAVGALPVPREPGLPAVVQLRQRFDGVEVFGQRFAVTLRADLGVVAMAGALQRRAPPPATKNRWTLTAADAEAIALRDLARVAPDGAHPVTRATRFWYAIGDALVPAWRIELRGHDAERSHGYRWLVAADDGRILQRHNLVSDASFTYRAWASTTGDKAPQDGPQGDSASPNPSGVPDGFMPALVARGSNTLQASVYRPNDPWLPVGAAQLEGNNAFAYADRGPDGYDAGDTLATASSASTFDHAFDPALDHDANPDQIRAAITHGFYVVNWLHDWFYAGGFNEMHGNMQTKNFGRGGVGNDPVLLEAQDASVFDNANAFAPADGGSGVLQMGVWSGDSARSAGFSGSAGYSANLDRTSTGGAQFGPQDFSVSAALVAATEVTDASGNLLDGCDPPFANAAQLVGRIALVQRGSCFFIVKARAAQAAGAIGLVVINQFTALEEGGGTFTMALPDGEVDDVTIPVLLISNEDGTPLRAALGGETITATLARIAGPGVDSTIDTTVLSHEWGHLLNNRQINFGPDTNGTQNGGLDEGYADFIALLVNAGPDSGANAYLGVYPLAAYLAALSDDDGYYFGLRRYPYSADMTKDPLTFKHIGAGVALPAGPPVSSAGADNTEVHAVGEVWATMLWECYVALLRDPRYTYTAARERMRGYVVRGQQATPANPTFVQARDGLLTVVQATDAADRTLFAAAFAKRGLGQGAVAPPHSSASNAGLVESFVPVAPSGGGGGGGGGGSGGGSAGGGGGGGAGDALSLVALLLLARRRGSRVDRDRA